MKTKFLHLVLALGFLLGTTHAPATAAPPAPGKPSASKVVFFASDGMRPDLMERYASEGVMPT